MYLLDSNVLIEAKNRYYAFDFCPAFWEWLILQNKHKKVYSIKKVKDEIIAGKDELKDWVQGINPDFFLKPEDSISEAFKKINHCLAEKPILEDKNPTLKYEEPAISTFQQAADYYLIAQAFALGATVVTHEVLSEGRKTVKIPNICKSLNITSITPYKMLSIEKAKFVLPSQSAQ